MGPRYFFYRIFFEFRRRTGLLKSAFPTQIPSQKWISLDNWKSLPVHFFFESREALSFSKSTSSIQTLQQDVDKIKQGYIQFFSADWIKVSNWHTNPDTGYQYDAKQHWTEIPDFSPTTGDIKYVWEKSRFSFLYTLIRYDYHFSEDQSEFVFSEIESWILENPTNCGPNWRCSQEMSLRVLNWTFALHYYKNSKALTNTRFEAIIQSIYCQLLHIEANINFSRIAVRNNHALTETLCLYLGGLLFPFFKEANRWKTKGKKWFEEEIAYQIYEDGTFLQFSMNYHRIVIQLWCWAIVLAEKNNEKWSEVVYERAQKSLLFLQSCQDTTTGWLPNYGNNDGALFFKLNDAHYRDYRPQLNALSCILNHQTSSFTEDCCWYGVEQNNTKPINKQLVNNQAFEFKNSGYYVFKETDSLTFVRCGAYKDRPFQADNLHLDIWVNGENLLRDAGSYKYNTDEHLIRYFAGTASHNTIMLGEFDQMQKGPRFVWYDWTKRASATITQSEEEAPTLVFDGKILAFGQAGNDIWHRRKVTKQAGKLIWVIEDWIDNKPQQIDIHQIWHPSEYCLNHFTMQCYDENNTEIIAINTKGWYSSLYGKKEEVSQLTFTTNKNYLKTIFCSNNPD